MFEIKPKTRKEIYMAYLAGDMSLELPEPLTRDEVTLYNLCQSHAYGSTTTVKEVLAECQLNRGYSGDGGLEFLINDPVKIVPGEKYIVNWNGVEYQSTAINPGADDLYVGNLVMAGMEDTGEPYVLQIYAEPIRIEYDNFETVYIYGVAIPFDGSTTLTISIRQEVTTVQKLSGKYVEGMGYSETGENAIVDNYVLPTKGDNAPELPNLVLALGETYTVIFDGNKFENLVCFDDSGYPTIGAPYEDFSEYPFNIYANPSGDTRCDTSDGAAHTVTVIGASEVVHPIDRKLLPDSLTVYWDFKREILFASTGNADVAMTYEEAKAVPVNSILALYEQRINTGFTSAIIGKFVGSDYVRLYWMDGYSGDNTIKYVTVNK